MTVSEALQQAFEHYKAGKLAHAEKLYAQILAVEPQQSDALFYTGIIANRCGRPGAVEFLRRAVALDPYRAHFLNDLGVILRAQGKSEEAMDYFKRAIQVDPGDAAAHYNLGLVLLLHRNFQQGWLEYEWRWNTKPFQISQIHCTKPRWDGSNLKGRKLLIHAEQGIGDMFQFIRYVFLIAKREPGAKLLFLCNEATESLIRRNLSQICTVELQVPPSSFDVWYPLMSLPLLCGTVVENIPAEVPYITPNRKKTKQWRDRLDGDRNTVKAGLVWAGSQANKSDSRRSLPLSTLVPVSMVQGVSFYSLQKGEAAQQSVQTPGFGMKDFTAGLHDFDDTAALIANLDLVISVDTAVAHLAGAMGKPVWVMLPANPDWRWMLNRDDSPWYPTMRLFRQNEIGNWDDVVSRIVRELSKGLSSPGS